MNESEERCYVDGQKAAWSRMLQECIRHLGYEGRTRESLILEREAAVSMLRHVCSQHGDNDWPDDGHLADVIEKHLGEHLGL